MALEIVQLLTHNSFFIEVEHIMKLQSNGIYKLYYECSSFFKENIPKEKIIEIQNVYDIFKKDSNEFMYMHNNLRYLLESFLKLLEYDDSMIKILACHIIIGGLSIVNSDVKKLYPDYCFSF